MCNPNKEEYFKISVLIRGDQLEMSFARHNNNNNDNARILSCVVIPKDVH